MSGRVSGTLSTDPRLAAVRERFDALRHVRDVRRRDLASRRREIERIDAQLAIADDVGRALELLSDRLFGRLAHTLESKLTIALQEVLEQPISFVVDRRFSRGAVAMRFGIERGGEREDILKGQGGSVLNVLSVGLRMFALKALDAGTHRRFLVLDEPDCWLRPDLVPRLVRIIRDAGRALGFQVLLISHHDPSRFAATADRVYRFVPRGDGVRIERVVVDAPVPDPEAGN